MRRILHLAARRISGGTPYLALFSASGVQIVGRRGRPPALLARLMESIRPEPPRFIDDLAAAARGAGIPWRSRFSGCAVFPFSASGGALRGALFVFLQPGRRLDPAGMQAFRDVADLVEACLEFVAGAGTTILPPAAEARGPQHPLRSLLENTSDIVFTQDLSGRFTAVNPVAEQVLGYSREELLAMGLVDLLPTDQRAQAEQILLEQFGGGGPQTYELQFSTRDGRSLEMEVTVHLLFRNGLPAGLIGFARDITPRKAEQAARREAEERLARLEAELEELSGYWSRLHELTQSRFPTFEALAQRCLEVGCEALRLPIAVLLEGPGGAAGVVRAVHPPGAAEIGGPAPSHLTEACETALSDASTAPDAFPAVVVPVTAAGRPWGSLSFSTGDGNSPASPHARRFAQFLASLIGARLAAEPARASHSAAPNVLPEAEAARERLEELIHAAQSEKRVCSIVLIESEWDAGQGDPDPSWGRRIERRVEEQLSGQPSARHGHQLLPLGPGRWLLLLPRLGRRRDLLALARRTEAAASDACRGQSSRARIQVRCGTAIYPQDGDDAAALLAAAEAEIAVRKARTGRKIRPGGDALDREHSLPLPSLEQLRQAFEQRQFCLRFQPQIQIDGELLGFEALLAWNHPVLGPVPASRFIAAVEHSGLIFPLGSWVLDEACRTAAAWRRAGHDLKKIAVNVSAPQFAHPDFLDSVIGALERHGLEPHVLELEVTERIAMSDSRLAEGVLRRLRELGVRVAIDDFGTGYSSLSYLTRLAVDTLKIDRSFLSEEAGETTARSTIEAIVALAHKLGLSVVAEGVEKVKQWQMLRQAGCDSVQGHLFGHPLSEDAARRLLENRTRRGVS